MWPDCKMWGKMGSGSEVGKVGALLIVEGCEYCVELKVYCIDSDHWKFLWV